MGEPASPQEGELPCPTINPARWAIDQETMDNTGQEQAADT
jgi:hypothetical protein